MRCPAIPTVMFVAALSLGACSPPPRVATTSERMPDNYGHKTMPDAWLTFLWACRGKNPDSIRACLTGHALKEFEAAAKTDPAKAVSDLFATFGETKIVINLDHFDPREPNGLKILAPETGHLIQIGAVRMENVEPNSLKLPHYVIARFDWDR